MQCNCKPKQTIAVYKYIRKTGISLYYYIRWRENKYRNKLWCKKENKRWSRRWTLGRIANTHKVSKQSSIAWKIQQQRCKTTIISSARRKVFKSTKTASRVIKIINNSTSCAVIGRNGAGGHIGDLYIFKCCTYIRVHCATRCTYSGHTQKAFKCI